MSWFDSCDFGAGWFAGVSQMVVAHPLDTVKVRLQTLPHLNFVSVLVNTAKVEGVRGFYRGFLFPSLTAGVLNSAFFGVYGNTLRMLETYRGASNHQKLCCDGGPAYPLWHLDCFTAGCIAGTACVTLSTPIELIKTKLQATAIFAKEANEPLKPVECVKLMYRHNGLKGLFKGFHIMVLRDSVSSGVYFLTYEVVRESLSSEKSFWNVGLAGGFAGVASWAVIIPLDVVKSRIQADDIRNPKYSGIIDCFVKSYRADGLKVFGRGFWIITFRAFPVNVISFVGYEEFLKFCKWMSQK
ncbi:solute carrier family 25 member 45 isoform X2 [Bemisia tabaci]|uniref:solute carrier family 25 member 45 isoform X2 n=1 Tax=Bemisia tabaci TaxID=7038 RepID=UPI0008F9D909|nr:PREDICTED: solute carrier family 25 member 45-like isoform X2 [Bemisia tabaci]